MKGIITHNGKFHADDVFAVATLELAHPDEKFDVRRTRDKGEIAAGDFVVDVGGEYDGKKFFDHHQSGGAGIRENGIPYASFGLVWKEFGAVICGGDFFVQKQIDDSLVASLDANDNGVKISEEIYPVSHFDIGSFIAAHNLTWLEEEELGEAAEAKRLEIFLTLVNFAKDLITRSIKRHKDKNLAYQLVKDIYEKSEDKRIIVLEKYMPSEDALMEFSEPVFVVYPQSDNKGWVAKTISKAKNSFESRLPFPISWAGKMDSDLQSVTGVPDALFCHNKRFLAVAGSKDGAIKLSELALNTK
ncbi:MAG: MYG1 family protein [Patescibacteria group bacterium]